MTIAEQLKELGIQYNPNGIDEALLQLIAEFRLLKTRNDLNVTARDTYMDDARELRDHLAKVTAERDAERARVTAIYREATATIERLDEAQATVTMQSKAIAKMHATAVGEDVADLRAELAKVTAERDEQRKAADWAMEELRGSRQRETDEYIRANAAEAELAKLNGPKCEDEECPDYDSCHPYHQHVGVQWMEREQARSREEIAKVKAERDSATARYESIVALHDVQTRVFRHRIRSVESQLLKLTAELESTRASDRAKLDEAESLCEVLREQKELTEKRCARWEKFYDEKYYEVEGLLADATAERIAFEAREKALRERVERFLGPTRPSESADRRDLRAALAPPVTRPPLRHPTIEQVNATRLTEDSDVREAFEEAVAETAKRYCERDPKCVWKAGHPGDVHCHTASAAETPPRVTATEAADLDAASAQTSRLLAEDQAMRRELGLDGETKTNFDAYFEERMKDPTFAEGYTRQRASLDAHGTTEPECVCPRGCARETKPGSPFLSFCAPDCSVCDGGAR